MAYVSIPPIAANMKHLSILVLFACYAITGPPVSRADTHWTSADGILTFSIPESKQLVPAEPPSPYTAFWISEDRKTTLTVLRYENQETSGLDRLQEAQALAKSVRGKAAWLPNHTVNGFELWCIKAVNDKYNVFQTMLRHDHVFYTISIQTNDPLDEAFIKRLLTSIAVKERGYLTSQDPNHMPIKLLGATGDYSPRAITRLLLLVSISVFATVRLLLR